MKIKTATIKAFLKKSVMEGAQSISEAVLKFEKDGLKINANSNPKQARVMSWLKTGVFEEYEELGNVCMNDLLTVLKVLDRFGEKITFMKEGNLLTASGDNKKVEIELTAEDFMSVDEGEPTLEFDDTFNMTATQLKGIFADVKLNKDAKLTITTEEKKVKFSNTGKYKFETVLAAPSCKGGVSVTFGEPFIDAVNALDGNLVISVKSDYPSKIVEKTENSIISIIAAPRVEGDD